MISLTYKFISHVYSFIRYILKQLGPPNFSHSTMNHFATLLIFKFSILALGQTAELHLWEHANQRGKEVVLTEATSNLVNYHFNDEVSSLWAKSGDWELYNDINYAKDRFVILEGHKLNVDRHDFYSSARPICSYVKDPTALKIRIYDYKKSQGAYEDIFEPVADLNDIKWDNKIGSVHVFKGYWEIYDDTNYSKDRVLVEPGSSVDVRNNKGSSIRPVCENYAATVKCILEKIEVVDPEQIPKWVGTEVIGVASAGTCHGKQEHELTLESTQSVEDSVSFETSEENEVNWSLSTSVSVEATNGVMSVTASVTAGVGGSKTLSSSQGETSSKGSSTLVGQTTEYQAPGAAILFGLVEKYELDKSDTKVKMHMKCPHDGKIRIKDSTMRMKSTSFQSAHFWPLTGQFNKEACEKNMFLKTCVDDVKNKYNQFVGKEEEIGLAFTKCFADGKGTVFKKKM